MSTCPICKGNSFVQTKDPVVIFNGKEFSYIKCKNCGSVKVDPFPGEDDFEKMYGNQEADNSSIQLTGTPESWFPRFHYRRMEMKYFNDAIPFIKGKKLLDYGCGSGFFMMHATGKGFQCTGVEFGEQQAADFALASGLQIIGSETFHNRMGAEKYDVIHLGHVLEHLPDPEMLIQRLTAYATNQTLWIIDGPLDRNACLSFLIIRLGSLLKGKKQNFHEPQHLTQTNYQSQHQFFERCGFETRRYKVMEQYHPLPYWKQVTGIKSFLRWLIAISSILISNIIPKFGNVFHFSGSLKHD